MKNANAAYNLSFEVNIPADTPQEEIPKEVFLLAIYRRLLNLSKMKDGEIYEAIEFEDACVEGDYKPPEPTFEDYQGLALLSEVLTGFEKLK